MNMKEKYFTLFCHYFQQSILSECSGEEFTHSPAEADRYSGNYQYRGSTFDTGER